MGEAVEEGLQQMGAIMDRLYWTERNVFVANVTEKVRIRIIAAGPWGPKEIGRLIRVLTLQAEMMAEDDAAQAQRAAPTEGGEP